MTEYPSTPAGWTVVRRESTGPFTTAVTYEHPDGRRLDWSSRRHRKHASRLSRVGRRGDRVWWAPHRSSWWISVLFVIGSICFLVSGYLAYVEVAGGLLSRVPRSLEGAVVSVNLFGCVAFGASAVAAYVLPSTGEVADVTVANAATSVGALGFLVGALLLLPEGAKARS